jgi:bla regulator protein BlaR1
MMPALTDHLWQSTVFILAAALVAAALRKNGAHVRHWIWLIASLKFLVPLSLLMSIGAMLPFARSSSEVTAPTTMSDFSVTVDQIAQPFTSGAFVPSATVPEAGTDWMPWLVAGLWVGGFALVIGMRVRGWRRVQAALRTSTPSPVNASVPVRSSPGLLEPGVVGLWNPVLLVPAGIEKQLTPRQFEAVLLHELCHVQRRDNFTSALHMIVEAVFWFHPLVWFIGARLVDERERACDEHVLRVSGDPAVYAESILNVCKLYVESPIACVSGVTGSDLKRRISSILKNHTGLQLNLVRKAALASLAVLVVTLPVAAGAFTAPIRTSVVVAPQSGDASTRQVGPRFDVVSVKPCDSDTPGGSRGGGGTPITSPGRLYLQCYPLASLIREAYLYFADGRANGLSSRSVGVEGGPDWMASERFLIEAKTGQVVPAAVMRGPMLQAVLEDRFKLKVRRVTREMPVYELVIARAGAKVSPYTGNECVIRDEAVWPPAAPQEGQRYCGDQSRLEGDRFIRTGVMKLDQLVSLFPFDRPVVNRTGITAHVSYRLDLTKEDTHMGQPPSASWISALRSQLGLDLRESKGPRDFLIIDSVQRPAPNTALPATEGTSAGQAGSRFDVVSIKPCPKDAPPPAASSGGLRRGGAPWHATVSPGYAFWSCVTLSQLVDQAFADQDRPLLNIVANPRQDLLNQPKRVRGGPSWVETEKFTIEAKAPPEVTSGGLAGNSSRVMPTLPAPMGAALRAVLEDRFKVQVRRATEQQSMFALTIASGGLNKSQISEPIPGDCMTPAEYSAAAATGDVPTRDQLKICGRYYSSAKEGLRFSSFTLQQLARELSTMMDHYVLDKTGVESKFNFTIKTEVAGGSMGDSLRFSRALEGLGLKLEPTKGPAEYLVIARAERPAPDFSPFGR